MSSSETPVVAPVAPWEATPVRDVVRVEGAEAKAFLQGQLSQDLGRVSRGEPAWSFVLQPTGKVDSWVRVDQVTGDGYELDVDAGFGESLKARLDRFKLRTKAEITLEAGGRVVETSDGPDPYELARVRAGVPAMGAELTAATIPAEVGQWIIDASVSFTKGCFTGQELVARIDSRGGNVPRHLRAVVFEPGSPVPTVGSELTVEGKVVGTLTSVAIGPDAPVALAYVARAVEPTATAIVCLPDATETPARVTTIPL